MEEVCSRNQKTLIGLMQGGRELVNQLKIHPQLSNSSEKYEFFMEKVASSFDNAIALLNSMALLENGAPSHITGNTSESPNLLENSSKSEGSDPDYKDKGVSKKRKMTQKWNEVVRVCSGAGLGSHLNDGYSWRKYGQKVILNTNHPRAYYRCTYLNTQRCLAKKHVQRTDADPSIFEVVYKGEHSCVRETIKQKKENFGPGNREEEGGVNHHVQQMVFRNDTGPALKVETQELDVTDDAKAANFPSFSFHSATVESEDSEDTTLFFDLSKETNYIGSYSTPFISPETSESRFSLSQGPVNGFVIGNSESDFAEIASNATTLTFEDLDLSIDQVDFDTKFLDAFDNFC